MEGVMKVASGTNVNQLAAAITTKYRQDGFPVSLSCVGAGAVNQAVKAVALSSQFLAVEVHITPKFSTAESGEKSLLLILNTTVNA